MERLVVPVSFVLVALAALVTVGPIVFVWATGVWLPRRRARKEMAALVALDSSPLPMTDKHVLSAMGSSSIVEVRDVLRRLEAKRLVEVRTNVITRTQWFKINEAGRVAVVRKDL